MNAESNGKSSPGDSKFENSKSDSRRNQNSRRFKGQPNAEKFEGKTEALKGFIYDTGTGAKERFAIVTKEIARHMAATATGAGEFISALEPDNLKFEKIEFPEAPDKNATQWDIEIKKEAYKDAKRLERNRADNQQQAFGIILGQCSRPMMEMLLATDTYKTLLPNQDVIKLLKLIRKCLHTGGPNKKKKELFHQDNVASIYSFRQGKKMTDSKYFELFKSNIDRAIDMDLKIGEVPDVINKIITDQGGDPDTCPDSLKAKAINQARERYFGILLIRNADPARHGKLMDDLNNNFTRGTDQFPKTISEAYNYLTTYKSTTKPVTHADEGGVAFHTETNSNNKPQYSQGGPGRGGGQGRGNGGRGNAGRGRGTNSSKQTQSALKDESSNKEAADEVDNNNDSDKPFTPYDISYAVVLFSKNDIPNTSVGLDSCSSANIISNSDLLQRIYTVPKVQWMPIVTVGQEVVYLKQKGQFGNYPEDVWYFPKGGANVMSLNNVQNHCRITMDSDAENAFLIHSRINRAIIRCQPITKSIYMTGHDGKSFNDLWKPVATIPSTDEHSSYDPCYFETVRENAKNHPKRVHKRAVRARKLQNIIMRPGSRQLADVAIRHLQTPVTKSDIIAADRIFGKNLGSLKGKTVRKLPPHVTNNIDPVPEDILSMYRDITLCVDIMFINRVPFFVTLSRCLKFATVEVLKNRQISTVAKVLHRVLRLYRHRGFKISSVFADHEFEPLRQLFPRLNTAAAGEHVPDIERFIRTVKERTRSTYSVLPYKYIPRLVLIHLVKNCVLWWNALPATDGISREHSPRYIMTGTELNYAKHVQLEFGSYVQTHEEHDNSMSPRTLGAICLGPTGNIQGGHWFMCLTSGSRITRYQWDELPMPTLAIQRVNNIGRNQGMPSTITYANRRGDEILDTIEAFDDEDSDNDDSSYGSVSSEEDEDLLYDTDDEIDNNNENNYNNDDEIDYNNENNNNESSSDDDNNNNDSSSDDDTYTPDDSDSESEPDLDYDSDDSNPNDSSPENSSGDSNDDDTDEMQTELTGADDNSETFDTPDDNEITGADDTVEPGESTGADETESTGAIEITEYDIFQQREQLGRDQATGNAELRPRARKYKRDPDFVYHTLSQLRTSHRSTESKLLAQIPEHCFLTAMAPHADELITYLTEQMSAKKGLQLFGERGKQALMKEIQQLLYRDVMHPVQAKSLTRDQKRAALKYLMFLKEKRSGEVKGRGCADGRKQRVYKTKEETHSPTVSTEAMFITAIFDALEGRDVAIVDIPGAFMQADIDELIHVRLDGDLVDLLVRLDPSYESYIVWEGKHKVIYTQLDKALYGTMQAALLFWRKLSSFLIETMGFTSNPYDSCVVNKQINGTQFTICWHVDDLKLSHKSPQVVTQVIKALQSEFGKEAPLTIKRGKVFDDYLGMKMDFSQPGKVIFSMVDYIQRIIDDCPDELMKGPCATPAANHLFHVNDDDPPLDAAKAEIYHHLTAMILYLAKKTRPDLQTAVSFLTTRVKGPTQDDWKKLGRCIRYLSVTKELPLTLEATNDGVIQWWVDASYAVHPNMRSHTGATFTLGKGSPYSISSKQKINTISSTEAELVGISDAMKLILWTRLFIEAQGYTITDNILHQDNQSTILLANHGKRSSTKNTKHIDIRYFFITDNISRRNMRISYCPTLEMRADPLTKPKQGSAFINDRKLLLNLP